MSGSIDQADVARAFSQHRFDEALPHLAPDVRWTIVGYLILEGADGVTRTCRDTLGSLAGTTAVWDSCRTVVQGDTVVVEVLGRYSGPDGVTAVASCFIYEFADSRIASITSYAVEVDPHSVGALPDTGG